MKILIKKHISENHQDPQLDAFIRCFLRVLRCHFHHNLYCTSIPLWWQIEVKTDRIKGTLVVPILVQALDFYISEGF